MELSRFPCFSFSFIFASICSSFYRIYQSSTETKKITWRIIYELIKDELKVSQSLLGFERVLVLFAAIPNVYVDVKHFYLVISLYQCNEL